MSENPSRTGPGGSPVPAGGSGVRIAVSWLLVGVPLAYGVFQTVSKAAALFG